MYCIVWKGSFVQVHIYELLVASLIGQESIRVFEFTKLRDICNEICYLQNKLF